MSALESTDNTQHWILPWLRTRARFLLGSGSDCVTFLIAPLPGIWMECSTHDSHSDANMGSHDVSMEANMALLTRCSSSKVHRDLPHRGLDDVRLPLYADIFQGIRLAVPTTQEG